MGLFDVNPKESLEDLFGRDDELRDFKKALGLGVRFVVIYGVRRVGKTSFLRAALKGFRYPHAIVDVREVHSEFGTIGRYHLYRGLVRYFRSNLSFLEGLGFRLRDFLGRVRGFSVSGLGIEVDAREVPSLTEFLAYLNDWAGDHGTRFVLAFDEAQYLRYSGVVRFDELFAWAIDNLKYLTIVVTGSEVGVLRDFLRLDDPKSPLFGRYVHEIKLDRFTPEQSMEFLRRGFSELGMSVSDDELSEVVKYVNGIPGWLTLYGHYRGVVGLGHREALAKVFDLGTKLVMEELSKVIAPSRRRYLAILEAVTHGMSRWSQIKTYVTAKTGPITDRRFTDLLTKLVKYSILEKKNNKYKITDPMTQHALKHLS